MLARKSRAAAWSRFQFVRDLGCAFGLVGCGSPAPLGRCESGLLGSGSALAGGRWGVGFAPRGALPERPSLEALSLAMAFLLGPLDTISGLSWPPATNGLDRARKPDYWAGFPRLDLNRLARRT